MIRAMSPRRPRRSKFTFQIVAPLCDIKCYRFVALLQTKAIFVRLEDDMRAELQQWAHASGRSVQALIRDILRAKLIEARVEGGMRLDLRIASPPP